MHYDDLILTNHARERLEARSFSVEKVWDTVHRPDKTRPGKKNGTTEFVRRFGKSVVTVIATRNEKLEWVILSCWIDPPLPGTEDERKRNAYRAYHRASFWGKIRLIIKEQFGL